MASTEDTEQSSNPWRIKYDKDFLRQRSLPEVGQLACQESTAHGVGHAWNNRHNPLGLLWLITTATFLVFLGIVTHSHVQDFSLRAVQSQTTVKITGVEGLQLPSFSICNRDYFSRRKLEALNVSSSLTNYLMAITGSSLMLREELLATAQGQAFLQESHPNLLQLMGTHNLSYHQLIDAISYRCEDLILQCTMGTRPMNKTECCRRFTPMPSLSGKCYTHFSTRANTQTIQGENMGVSLHINVTEGDRPVINPKVLDVSKFVKAGLHMSPLNSHTHPTFTALGQGVTLVPRVYTAVSLSVGVVKDEGTKTWYDWTEEDCVPPEEVNYKQKEAFFSILQNCDIGALRTCFRHFCNCSNYSLDYSKNDSWTPCSVEENLRCFGLIFGALNISSPSSVYDAFLYSINESRIDQCWEEAKSRCRRTCKWNDYTYTSTHLPVHDYLYEELRHQYSLPNGSDVAIVMAFFPNLRYTETKLWRKGVAEFMSTLGGYTGVFLGCSFITFIEVFVFMALIIAVLVRNLKRKIVRSIQP